LSVSIPQTPTEFLIGQRALGRPGSVPSIRPPAVLQRAPSRLMVVDLARVLAILFMVQGHALDVLLAPGHRQGPVYASWLFLRGLTAPMFFVLSGISFTLSSLKYWTEYARGSSRLLRRLRRFTFFVLLGYVMHFPVKSFSDFQYLNSAGWQGWLQVDV